MIIKSSGDKLTRLSEMMELSLGIKANEDYFQWKYIDNPAGEFVAFEALSGDQVAGFYGVIPEYYRVNGKQMLIHQSMDTMVHPNFRKRGLFTTLAKKTYDFLEEEHEDVVIVGVSGTQSTYGFTHKLDWRLMQEIPYRFQYKRLLSIRSIFNSKKVVLKDIKQFDSSHGSVLMPDHFNNVPLRKELSAEFMNWRVVNNPLIEYRAQEIVVQGESLGLLVYHEHDNTALIDFISFRDKTLYKELAQAVLLALFDQSTKTTVSTWQANTQLEQQFQDAAGLMKNTLNKGPFSFKKPFIVYQGKQANSVDSAWSNYNNYQMYPLIQD